MHADRLLQLMLMLQTYERVSARELAARLGVSTRTVQRDLEALSVSGVPIYAVRGRGGGWSLLPGYRSRLTGMTPGEAMTVFVGSTAHVLADLGLGVARDRAQTKLLAALPAEARRAADYARQRVHVDHPAWHPDAGTPAWLDTCRRAVWGQRRVIIRYAGRDRDIPLDPLGLVAKGRSWYVVARRTDGQIYSYRMSRIDRVDLTEEFFDRPADFDLQAYWGESLRRFRAQLPSYVVTLRLKNTMLDRLHRNPPPTVTALEPGWSHVEADFEVPEAAVAFVLGLGGDATLLSPPKLRAEVRRAAARVARQHQG